MTTIKIEPLTPEAFAPFGQILDATGAPDKIINQGKCGRYHDRATLDFADGRAAISIFKAEPRALPYTLDLVERHPDGSQAFLPMYEASFLVIVAPDDNGTPGTPLAFRTAPGQGINLNRGTWHGVLTPLAPPGLFAVVDRVGPGANLEEHWFDTPYIVTG
ncbi:ureidoglycolate lyase [Maritimibacter sp. DP1N21-5]|uniref:ureidoglycolate lyase n=1 Tax=Maritimibacter sp. DP1N21-5 TaxID=2836867 RepID=UPI001C43F707|nr:ureidoglycolate lyase [Maritimibacter sp. DP1N21-5]MBV7409260.1 ureidoglycolate lyase [Maritimibacter sp. DP1N21-5]